jgi:hypothetical protein
MNDVEAAVGDKLTHFNIANNPSGDSDGARAFAAIVKKCKALVNVQYANCKPGADGSAAIVDALTYLSLEAPTLCYVDLRGLHLRHNSDQLLGALLKFKSLEDVDVRDTQLNYSQINKFQWKLTVSEDTKLDLLDHRRLRAEGDDNVEDNVLEFDMSQQVARH